MTEPTCLRIVVCGGVDSGKSSLIGVLTHRKLDDGKGSARSSILRTKHEKDSGRTSNVSYDYIKYPDKEVTLIDLAGHEKYLKTTLFGITGHFPDYAIIIVGSNMGVNRMTQEHMTILHWLCIPFIILMTKKDICPDPVYIEHRKKLRQLIKCEQFNLKSTLINTEEEFDKFYIGCSKENCFRNIIPIITISSKTGENIENIHNMFKILPTRNVRIISTNIPEPIKNISILAYIECAYKVHGVGLVLTGSLGVECTPITVGSNLYVGPYGDEKIFMVQVRVRSLHDNFRTSVQYINPGQSFCANVHPVSASLVKENIRKGLVITSHQSIINKMSRKFVAIIKIFDLKTTVGINYSPTIHYRTVRQSARVIQIAIIDGQTKTIAKFIRADETAQVVFEFVQRPEYIEEGAPLFFRDGNTRGTGKIIGVFTE